MGIGTVVGSAVFNVLFVIGMCAIFSKGVLVLTWWPLFRDCCWYIIALSFLGGFFANGDGGTIIWSEALVMFLIYVLYVAFMSKNEAIEKWFKEKVLPSHWGLSELKDSGDENAVAVVDDGMEASLDPTNSSFQRSTRFRVGVLQLLLQDHFDVANLGVHLVSRIKGSASQVFDDFDVNKNGLLESDEMVKLLIKLGLDSSPEAAASAIAEIKNGEINTKSAYKDSSCEIIFKKEFVAWYLTCEERIRGLVDKSFRECDTDNSGHIDFSKLESAINKLTGKRATEDDLIQVYLDLGKVSAEQTIPSDILPLLKTMTIDLEEFKSWYFGSLFWTERAAELEAAAEGVEGINPFHLPLEKSLNEQIRFVLLMPLTVPLGLTLVNSQDEGNAKYCFYAFFGSITWIGVSLISYVANPNVVHSTSYPFLLFTDLFLLNGNMGNYYWCCSWNPRHSHGSHFSCSRDKRP